MEKVRVTPRGRKTRVVYRDDRAENLLLHGDRLRILGEDDSGLDEVPLRVIGWENNELSTVLTDLKSV